jgi:DUF4097 and DUF4098 domain-containing protein YvlB
MSQRRKSIWAGALTGLLLALLFTAGVEAQAEQRDEFHNTYQLAANGRVSLANINGDVAITTWDRNEVKVDAIKTAATKERLDEAKIVVNAQADSIAIKTEYPHSNGWRSHDNPANVRYTLTVPRNARLDEISLVNGDLAVEGVTADVHAESVNGTVVAKGLRGRAELSTVNGRVEADFAQLQNDVRLTSVNGTLAVIIPSDARAEVSAETMNGHISNDFGLNVQDHMVGHNLRGTIGTGGPQLALVIYLGFYAICLAMTWRFYLRKSPAEAGVPGLAEARV